jgi:hypothetical protein
MARYYGLPIRSVGGTTDSKREDLQAGFERMGTLLPAVLAGVNLITCAGTLDSTMLESHALLLLDDEICGAALRWRAASRSMTKPGAGPDQESGFSGSYITPGKRRSCSARNCSSRPCSRASPTRPGRRKGRKLAIDHARERAWASWPSTCLAKWTRPSKRNWTPSARWSRAARFLPVEKQDFAACTSEEKHKDCRVPYELCAL